jgi:uncharacterized protein (TIGR03083 family)
MTDDELFAALGHSVDALAGIDPADLGRDVPSCPGWTVADLLGHVTHVHRWATKAIVSHSTDRPPFGTEELPAGPALPAFFREGADALVAALHAADFDEVVFTWAGPRPLRWWLRRQAHETAVHAWDGGHAIGHPRPIEASVAVDGIDEYFDEFVPLRFKTAVFAGNGETMHLHATDVDGEWLVRFDPDQVVMTREHGKGDVAVRGTASELLLLLWNRSGYDTLTTFGEVEVLDRFRAVARF